MNNQKSIKTSFWDFKTPKVYTNIGERILDFLVGFFIPYLPIRFLWIRIVSFRFKQLGEMRPHEYYPFPIREFLPFLILYFIIILLLILGIFYFWKRRRHFARGLLVSLIFFAIPSIVTLLITLFKL